MNLNQTSDVNDAARAVKPLQIAEQIPQPRRMEMPSMSDNEIYLRINVPDGLENNGEQPQKYITQVIDSREGSGSAIRKDPSA
jgi:hypothetical protein